MNKTMILPFASLFYGADAVSGTLNTGTLLSPAREQNSQRFASALDGFSRSDPLSLFALPHEDTGHENSRLRGDPAAGLGPSKNGWKR